MTSETSYLLQHFPVRKSADPKAAFRDWLTGVLAAAGYEPEIETGGSLVKSSNVEALASTPPTKRHL